MGHERGDLDDDWGYAPVGQTTTSEEVIIDDTDASSVLQLSILVQDAAALHTLCLEAFRKCAGPHDTLLTETSLDEGLNHIMSRLQLEPFEHSDILDLWFGEMNFAEFYLLVRELLVSMHRAVNADIDAHDVLANELKGLKV